MTNRTAAERLDEAVDSLLSGGAAPRAGELQPLVDVAVRLAAALPPIPAGDRFRERLASRLEARGALQRRLRAVTQLTRRSLNDRRLLTAGAVSSAAVGVTVTAVAVWRTSRRHTVPARHGHR